METLTVRGNTGVSSIHVGEAIEHLPEYLAGRDVVIITDENVGKLYQPNFPEGDVIRIGTGEKIKNLDTVKHIIGQLIECGADRSTFIVGIGGGIVCDIAGFVASIYLRGIEFGFVATTLLAQVDASVGGKNGVNLAGYKNMIGIFNQPEFVICDPDLLKTLPRKELLCGFAEIVKHAVIADSKMFAFLEDNYQNAVQLDRAVIERLIIRSVEIKAAIVNKDEKEGGERRKLNFGHTFGHAVEKSEGIPHGEAVSLGMRVAAELSVRKGLLSSRKADRIKGLLANLSLPVERKINRSRVIEALYKDKKREKDLIRFVLLEDIGRAVVKEIPVKDLEALVDIY
jgi:3-dehydroquinate synthase